MVQFAARNGKEFADAAELVAPFADAVDLNCGCPQRYLAELPNTGSLKIYILMALSLSPFPSFSMHSFSVQTEKLGMGLETRL